MTRVLFVVPMYLVKLAKGTISEVAISWFDSAEESTINLGKDAYKMLVGVMKQARLWINPFVYLNLNFANTLFGRLWIEIQIRIGVTRLAYFVNRMWNSDFRAELRNSITGVSWISSINQPLTIYMKPKVYLDAIAKIKDGAKFIPRHPQWHFAYTFRINPWSLLDGLTVVSGNHKRPEANVAVVPQEYMTVPFSMTKKIMETLVLLATGLALWYVGGQWLFFVLLRDLFMLWALLHGWHWIVDKRGLYIVHSLFNVFIDGRVHDDSLRWMVAQSSGASRLLAGKSNRARRIALAHTSSSLACPAHGNG